MGISEGERTDRQRIMVYLVNGVRTGFIVDSVSEVLKIQLAAITDSPNTSDAAKHLIPRVANLPQNNRMILLIDHAALLNADEINELSGKSTSAPMVNESVETVEAAAETPATGPEAVADNQLAVSSIDF